MDLHWSTVKKINKRWAFHMSFALQTGGVWFKPIDLDIQEGWFNLSTSLIFFKAFFLVTDLYAEDEDVVVID